MATAIGACDRASASIRNRTPLATNEAGTHRDGGTRREALGLAITSTIEHSDVASSIAGRAVRSSEVRNSASLTALPLTNCAVTAVAPTIAATTGLDCCVMRMVIPVALRRATRNHGCGEAGNV